MKSPITVVGQVAHLAQPWRNLFFLSSQTDYTSCPLTDKSHLSIAVLPDVDDRFCTVLANHTHRLNDHPSNCSEKVARKAEDTKRTSRYIWQRLWSAEVTLSFLWNVLPTFEQARESNESHGESTIWWVRHFITRSGAASSSSCLYPKYRITWYETDIMLSSQKSVVKHPLGMYTIKYDLADTDMKL